MKMMLQIPESAEAASFNPAARRSLPDRRLSLENRPHHTAPGHPPGGGHDFRQIHVHQTAPAAIQTKISRYSYGSGTPRDAEWRELTDKEQQRSEKGMSSVSDVVQNSANKKHTACTNQFDVPANGGICPSGSRSELLRKFNGSVIWLTSARVLGESLPPFDVAFAGNTLFTPLQVAGTAIHEFGHNCGVGTSAAEEESLEKTTRICGLM